MHVPMSILKRAVALRLSFFSSPAALDLPLSEAAAAARAEAVEAEEAAGAGKADAPSLAPPLAVPPGGTVAGVDSDGDSGAADGDKGATTGEGSAGAEAGPDAGTGAAKVADKASVATDADRLPGTKTVSEVGESVAGGEGGAGMLLKGYVTVGGMMHFQMLAIPAAPKKVGA